ncbi:MAG: monofunctional biosynthetic peptidoglycan transglycosylase [Deltaproteobacteria bacterium]|nr:monofunctional biosynthetic peptidoglycan transglycosylase [Deltaproteobacteria bacterium]
MKKKIILILIVVFGLVVGWFSYDMISLKKKNPGPTALMQQRGTPIHQTWVPLSRISPFLKRAVIVAEDASFYGHNGIDFHEFVESLKKNIEEREFHRGFSTITMQVARNLYLSPGKTIPRKLMEIVIAWVLEQTLSKNRIFEIYLNIIEWGDHIYGAEAASQHYFKKSAIELSPAEAAFLASIIPSPLKWGQWPPGPYVWQRVLILLNRMNPENLQP